MPRGREVNDRAKSRARLGSLSPLPTPDLRLELPPEEGPPYSPEFYSGWEPPATDPQGRAWEDPVEKQLQHERRRRQVRLRLPGEQQAPRRDTAGRGLEVWPRLTSCSHLLQQSAPQVAVNG